MIRLIVVLFFFFPSIALATDYYIETTSTTVDGDTFCGGSACDSGDLLIIRGGNRGDLRFQDFDGAGSYITIKNEDTNRVVITENGTALLGTLSFDDCKYIDVRGDNNPSFTYGIEVINGVGGVTGTVWVSGESDHIKLGYMEIYNSGASGYGSSGIKVQDETLTNSWAFDSIEIHHNYIHDTTYSGMYLGHNRPDDLDECAGGCPYTANFSIHDNLLENLGSYGFNYKGLKTGSTSNIYNNTVRITGINCDGDCNCCNSESFKHGISASWICGDASVNIYNNRTEKTEGPGLSIGSGDVNVYGNIILGSGLNNDRMYGHGIKLHNWSSCETGSPIIDIYDNIIVEANGYGISDYGSGLVNALLQRNVIAESGLGAWENDQGGVTAGTGANANVYDSDLDDGIGDICFQQWSDDSNYSNDDFTLDCAYPYSSSGFTPTGAGMSISGGKINQ